MSGLLLSAEERHRFIEYCQNEAASLAAMAEQIKLPAMDMVSKNYNVRAMAYKTVANDLSKVEDMSL